MRRTILVLGVPLIVVPMLLVLDACGKVQAQADLAAAGAPPEAKVVPFSDPSLFGVDHPEQCAPRCQNRQGWNLPDGGPAIFSSGLTLPGVGSIPSTEVLMPGPAGGDPPGRRSRRGGHHR